MRHGFAVGPFCTTGRATLKEDCQFFKGQSGADGTDPNLHNYSNFSPYFFINILYSYVRLALVNVLLVRTLAVWRMKQEEKKADVIRQ